MRISSLNKNNTYERIIIIEFILTALICIFELFQLSELVSLSFYMTFFALIPLVVRTINRKSKIDVTFMFLLLIIFLAIFNVLINFLLSYGNQIGFSYFKKVIMFLSTLLLFYVVTYEKKTSERIKNTIFLTFIAVAVLYILAFIYRKDLSYMFRGGYDIYLTFGMSNPNKTGLFLLCLCIYAVVFYFIMESKIYKIMCAMIFPVLFYFIILTKARNAIIAIVLFVILVIIFGGRKKNVPRLLVHILLWYPLFFWAVYILAINSQFINDHFSFLVSEGKDLISRYAIWVNGLEILTEHPIFGGYFEISNGTGESQMLNTHLDVLASYGIFVFLLLMDFLRRIIKVIYYEARSLSQRIALIGFLGCIIAGSGEAALFSGGTGIYILISGFLLLAKYNPGVCKKPSVINEINTKTINEVSK